MRLINTATLKLEEYFGNRIPKYAILSHTWGDEELSFQEFKSLNLDLKAKQGYSKIAKCCQIAKDSGYSYAWVDTCCIDKTSSHELSEAINSMFAWYEKSEACYAYLTDVKHEGSGELQTQIKASRWFRRGWTLQELLAPARVMFFDANWLVIDTREAMAAVISAATGISNEILVGTKSFRDCSVAAKMSWASNRETTREEDIAYCLLGIFGIFMPLLYGEGQRSFIRLQEEIMKVSMDHSLFAWTTPFEELKSDKNTKDNLKIKGTGLLAESPRAFKSSGRIDRRLDGNLFSHYPFSLTNNGCINIRLRMSGGYATKDQTALTDDQVYLVALECSHFMAIGGELEKDMGAICMYVRRGSNNKYRRVLFHHLCIVDASHIEEHQWETKEISIQAFLPIENSLRLEHLLTRGPPRSRCIVFAPELNLLLRDQMPFVAERKKGTGIPTISRTQRPNPGGVVLAAVYPPRFYRDVNREDFNGDFGMWITRSPMGVSMGIQFLLTKRPLYRRFNLLFGVDVWDITWCACIITTAETTLEQIFQDERLLAHRAFMDRDGDEVTIDGTRLRISFTLQRKPDVEGSRDRYFSLNLKFRELE